MAGSTRTSGDYARTATVVPTAPLAQRSRRRFQPRLWPTLAAVVLVPLFFAAGQWQWNKAGSKADQQHQLDARGAQPAMQIPATLAYAPALRYRKIVALGHYEAQYQILIDNRTYRGQAGYHVITPLRIAGSDIRVLVNRGWIPAADEHSQVPPVATPPGPVELSGTAIVPGTRFFTLGADQGKGTQWQAVWQNLDLDRYGKAVAFPLQPIVIQLDAESSAGGFVRAWPHPDERIQTNLGYALQWWAFAATTVVLWLFFSFGRPS